MVKRHESTDQKIDNLALVMAKGFKSVRKEFNSKIDNLAQMTAKGFKDLEERLTGKIDNTKEELKREFNNAFEDHMKDVRTDYDSLSSRVKKLETVEK